jgi:flagellar L-ring protein precursor FlgH
MSVTRLLRVSLCVIALMPALHGAAKKKKVVEPSALDKYIQEALSHDAPTPVQASAGSLWTPSSRITDLGSDLRAIQVNDLVTVVVAEQASAVATGATQTSRKSSVGAALSGSYQAKSVAASLNTANDIELNGAGSTSRSTQLSTTLSARVTHVLPNGYLVLEGTKDVQVNSEHQFVKVRGIIRPIDLSPGNVITSNQLAQLEINIDGKGVVNDAIRRPNFLYRLILGLLPF